MDKNPKYKIRSRHRKKNEKKSLVSAPSKEKEPSGGSAGQPEQETPVKGKGKPIADLHSCYQFMDSEPVIVWGSPHVSPSYEVRAKQLSATLTPQHRSAGKERFQRPARSFVKGTSSPSQFLRGLMDFSEQFKGEKVKPKDQPDEPFVDLSCSTEVPLSVEVSGAALLGDADGRLLPPPPSPVYRPCPEELEQIKRDNLQELFDDADDDIMLKCSQEVEEIIRKVSCAIPQEEEGVGDVAAVASTPLKKVGGQKQSIEWTPKNRKTGKGASRRAGGSSGKRAEKVRTPDAAPGNIFKAIVEDYGEPNPQRQGQTPKNRQTRSTPRRAGGSSVKKGGDTPLSEGRRSLRLLRGGGATTTSARLPEDLRDAVGGDSFDDVIRKMLEDDFVTEPAESSPRRKAPPCRAPSGPSSAGRRKSPRLLKGGGEAMREKCEDIIRRMMDDDPPAGRNGNGPQPTIWESFRSEDVDESDLAKALDFVESQTIKSSPPLRCTPDEILQKKLEAKRRLAKKKLSRCNNGAGGGGAFLRPKR